MEWVKQSESLQQTDCNKHLNCKDMGPKCKVLQSLCSDYYIDCAKYYTDDICDGIYNKYERKNALGNYTMFCGHCTTGGHSLFAAHSELKCSHKVNNMDYRPNYRDNTLVDTKQLLCIKCKQCLVHQKLDVDTYSHGWEKSIASHQAKLLETDNFNANEKDYCKMAQCGSESMHYNIVAQTEYWNNEWIGNEFNDNGMVEIPNQDSDYFNYTNTKETTKSMSKSASQPSTSASIDCYQQCVTINANDTYLTRPVATLTAVLKILRLAIFLLAVEGIATIQGQMTGYNYRSAVSWKSCQSNDGCRSAIGEVCWWAWDGCDSGECMCDPRTSFHDSSTGFCRPLKYGGERCEPGDKCWQGMVCSEGFCRCTKGGMTSDKMFCLLDNEKLLGQRCSDKDTCFQRAKHGYTKSETHCGENGRCRCDEGFKEDGWTCRKWNVNEPGCSKDHHCQGGALCVDSVCRCPSTYIPVAQESKCAKYGARHDLQLRQTCDEVNEDKYCAYGLVCHRCAGSKKHTCVKFIEAEALPYRFSSSRSLHRYPYFTILLSSFLFYIITWTNS